MLAGMADDVPLEQPRPGMTISVRTPKTTALSFLPIAVTCTGLHPTSSDIN